jgi:Transposase zinc-binding domain
MDIPTNVVSIFSANFMDTPQPADSSIFKAPGDVHFFYLARSACGPTWRSTVALNLGQLKVMSAIEQCRSAALGGHVLRCSGCSRTSLCENALIA